MSSIGFSTICFTKALMLVTKWWSGEVPLSRWSASSYNMVISAQRLHCNLSDLESFIHFSSFLLSISSSLLRAQLTVNLVCRKSAPIQYRFGSGDGSLCKRCAQWAKHLCRCGGKCSRNEQQCDAVSMNCLLRRWHAQLAWRRIHHPLSSIASGHSMTYMCKHC